MKERKNSKGLIVGIVAAPFVLMLFLHIGIAVGQYFKIDIKP
mgnify:CR=1 FL=1